MTLDDEILQKGYEYILQPNHHTGYLSELDQFDDKLAIYFISMGILATGINSCSQLRYQLTLEGETKAKRELLSLRLKVFHEKNNTA